MSAILIFIVFVLIGDTAAVGISAIVERFSNSLSLIVFFVLFAFIFWAAWKAAVFIAERYILRQS